MIYSDELVHNIVQIRQRYNIFSANYNVAPIGDIACDKERITALDLNFILRILIPNQITNDF